METFPSVAIIDEISNQVTQTVAESSMQSTEYSAEDFRRNSGSYRKRKAKKQVDAETTVEDLRGKCYATLD